MPQQAAQNIITRVNVENVRVRDNSRFLELPVFKCVDEEGNPLFGATPLSNVWNCYGRCIADPRYYIPAPDWVGHWEYFQFQEPDLVSADPTAPSANWYATGQTLAKVYIGDCTGGDLTDIDWELLDVNNFDIQGWNAWVIAEGRNIQSLRLNPYQMYQRLLVEQPTAGCCFMFKFEFQSWDGAEYTVTNTYYSQQYTTINCEEDLIYLECDEQPNCDGQWYGNPDDSTLASTIGTTTLFNYQESLLLRAKLTYTGTSVEREDNDWGEAYQVTAQDVYHLLGSPVPPFVGRTLSNIFTCNAFVAKFVHHNGASWAVDGTLTLSFNGSTDKSIKYNQMWKLDYRVLDGKCILSRGCG